MSMLRPFEVIRYKLSITINSSRVATKCTYYRTMSKLMLFCRQKSDQLIEPTLNHPSRLLTNIWSEGQMSLPSLLSKLWLQRNIKIHIVFMFLTNCHNSHYVLIILIFNIICQSLRRIPIRMINIYKYCQPYNITHSIMLHCYNPHTHVVVRKNKPQYYIFCNYAGIVVTHDDSGNVNQTPCV